MVKILTPTESAALNIALDTIEKKKQAIVFVNTKRSAEKTAEDLSLKLKGDEESFQLAEKILKVLSKPTRQCERLSRCIKKGTAFHHAGLASKQRELIEDAFRSGVVKVICATPTLASGLDLPAFRVIMKDLKRYGHHGLSYIPVLEYMQMTGRAGRPKFDKFGEAITIAQSEDHKDEIKERFIDGDPELIYSKLAVEPVLRTYVLSLIASEFVTSKQKLFEFFSKTFFAHQYGDTDKINMLIDKILMQIEEWELITSSLKEDFVSGDEVSDEKFKATLLGKRISELYLDPLTAHEFVIGLERAKSKMSDDFSFLQLISNTLEMRPLLRVKVKDHDWIQEELNKQEVLYEPSMYEDEYDDFMRSVKTALFFLDWIDEQDEEFLLEKYDIRPGEINVKLSNANWLLYGLSEITRILNFKKLTPELKKLRLRVKAGVKEELLTLLRLEKIGRARARKMYRNGIKDIGDVKKVEFAKLAGLLGKNIAIDVKQQVGQEVKVVRDNKRKGQLSLNKYKAKEE